MSQTIISMEELEKIRENEGYAPDTAAFLMAEHLVLKQSIIEKDTIKEYINKWQSFRRLKMSSKDIKQAINSVWSNKDTFKQIKSVAYKLGSENVDIMLDRDQLTEAGEYLKGKHHIKRVELTGDLLFFNNCYYEKNAELLIRRNARTLLAKSKNLDILEILTYIQDSCDIIKSKDIEHDVHLKCLLNGVYNIKTGEFSTEFNPDHMILNQIPHNYNEEVDFDVVKTRINEIIVDDKDRQSYFDFGSTCLHPYTGIDIQFGGVGIPGTGKTKLVELLVRVFGEDNVSNAKVHKIASDPTTQRDIAYYFLNIDEEMRSDDVANIEILKTWITQGRLTARSIYGHNTTFRPTSRLMFVTNTIYEIGNPEDAVAMYERTHLIKLSQKFRHTSKEIKDVVGIIDEEEFDGFITYLLKNATDVYERRNITYPQSTQATESLWNEYGNQVRGFIDKWLVKGVGLKEQSSEIWNRFFMEQNEKGLPVGGRNKFHKKFDEIIGSTSTQIRDGEEKFWGYLGYKLRTVDELAKQETLLQTPKGRVLKFINKLDPDSPKINELLELLE